MLTDYREESTFSFDPGKLPLVLLEKGHHADQARQKKARMDARMLANRNHLSGLAGVMDEEEQSPPRQHPHVADLVWALAKSEAAKLEAAKRDASCHKLDAASGDGPPLAISPSVHSATAPLPFKEILKVKPLPTPSGPHERRLLPVVASVSKDEEEMGFSLDIAELSNCQNQQQQQLGLDCCYDTTNPIKECDSDPLGGSCVLFQSTHFASSFNTDVGYSSETSRAPSYPSSVVFKRRTYTTNKSISQNYSSLTESIGSQPACDLATLDGGLIDHRSPQTTNKPASLNSNGSDPRRLSYKRACDPEKRFSLGLDSMTRLSACDSAQDLSLNSAVGVTMGEHVFAPGVTAPREDPRRKGKEERRLHKSRQASEDPSCTSSTSSVHGQHQYVTEGTETDDRWLKRRQSYQKSSKGNNNHRMNSHHHHHHHHNQTHIPEDSSSQTHPSRLMVTLEFCLAAMRFVRSLLQRIIASPWIDFVITISIVLNTAFLAAEHHGMSPDVKHVLDVGNKVRPHTQTSI